MNNIPDAPYIQNYMATGEEYPKPYNRELERLKERLTMLEDERQALDDLMGLSFDIKEDAIEHYNREIRECEREISFYTRAYT